MRLERVTLSGFRCFGPQPIMAFAPNITAVVGPIAAGRRRAPPRVLQNLWRNARAADGTDFHGASDVDPDDLSAKTLFIDAWLSSPSSPTAQRRPRPWPTTALWRGKFGSQDLYWVDSLEPEPAADKDSTVPPADRALIQLYYTPASRDAAAQVRATAGALAARLLRLSNDLKTAFEGETAIAARRFKRGGRRCMTTASTLKPRPSLVRRRLEEVINKIAVIFEQGPDGCERGIERWSAVALLLRPGRRRVGMERQVALSRRNGA